MMVGRTVRLQVDRPPAKPGEAVLEVRGLSVPDDRGHTAVDDVDFEVRAGEILAVAGVQGNGQTELVEALTGLRPAAAGSVRLGGRELTQATPREVLASGVGHVPEDRLRDGLVVDFPVADNLVLNTYRAPPFAHGLVLDFEAIHRTARERVKDFDIRTPSVETPAANLSGGNQQKVIVAREFSRPIRLLIASQPTRGLDVGSIQYIHERIVGKRDEGTAVLIVSSELDEVIALADRIAVMYRGRITGLLEAGAATREEIGLMMAGVSAGAANGASA
jgi:simple sugar transport system ATP-binding protein